MGSFLRYAASVISREDEERSYRELVFEQLRLAPQGMYITRGLGALMQRSATREIDGVALAAGNLSRAGIEVT